MMRPAGTCRLQRSETAAAHLRIRRHRQDSLRQAVLISSIGFIGILREAHCFHQIKSLDKNSCGLCKLSEKDGDGDAG